MASTTLRKTLRSRSHQELIGILVAAREKAGMDAAGPGRSAPPTPFLRGANGKPGTADRRD